MDILIAVAILGGSGLLLGFLLSLASKVFAVSEDKKTADIRAALPGANCGSCGYAGCDSYAEAVAKGDAEPNLCTPGGADAASAIGEILGVTVKIEEKKAVVLCQGNCDNVGEKYEYSGMRTCAAAAAVLGGPSDCRYGCIGYGDCQAACNFDAIKVISNLATVDTDKCTGCSKCVTTCPKGIIKLYKTPIGPVVACNNKDKGPAARKVCKTACIGCGLCAKNCPAGAIEIKDNLAEIDPAKCTSCRKCAEVCPMKCII